MINIPENPPIPKRVLTKVRRRFLNKTPDPSQPVDAHVHALRSINSSVNILNPCIGLVEVNGKVYLGMQSLNPYLILSPPQLEVHSQTRAVNINLHYIEGLNHSNYEESIRKLESYGDLEMASWASRLRRYHQSYPILMAQYFNTFRSADPNTVATIRKAKNRAVLKIREIESTCSYRKLLNFFDRDSAKLISTSYSESLLKEMGYTPEEFVSWTSANGLPKLFGENAPTHIEIAKDFLDNVHLEGEPVKEGPEYTIKILDKHGNSHTVLGQYTYVVEPTPEGLFVSGYFIMKRKLGPEEPRPAALAEEERVVPVAEQMARGVKLIKKEDDKCDGNSTDEEDM